MKTIAKIPSAALKIFPHLSIDGTVVIVKFKSLKPFYFSLGILSTMERKEGKSTLIVLAHGSQFELYWSLHVLREKFTPPLPPKYLNRRH